jgi:hypothetical protein
MLVDDACRGYNFTCFVMTLIIDQCDLRNLHMDGTGLLDTQ